MSYITRGKNQKTNFAAVNDQVALDVSQLNVVRFEFSGTYAFTSTFEISNDSTTGLDGTWFPLQMVQTNTNVVALTHATANATQAYEANVNNATWVRSRVSAFTSAGAHKVLIVGTDAATEPNPVVQVAGTVPVTSTSTPATGTAISVNTTAGSNLSNQKATAGNLFELSISNPTATAISVKVYNKATAPVVASDIPVITETVAAGATVSREYGQLGKRFATGISLAATALPADTDATAAVAGVHISGTYN